MKVRCKNCRLEFTAGDDSRVDHCPRCDSRSLEKTRSESPASPTAKEGTPGASATSPSTPRVYSATGQVVYGDTKAAWQSYHSSTGSGACPHCGGTAFDFVWKRKEKICKKCGEILPLPRKMA